MGDPVCVCKGLIGWQASVWVGRCSSVRILILMLADGVLCSVLLEEHSLPTQERICLAACCFACSVCVCVTEWVCAQMSMHVCMYMCAHMCACVSECARECVWVRVCVCLFCCFAYRPSFISWRSLLFLPPVLGLLLSCSIQQYGLPISCIILPSTNVPGSAVWLSSLRLLSVFRPVVLIQGPWCPQRLLDDVWRDLRLL